MSGFQIRLAAVSPPGEHCVCGLLLASPATSVHPIGKNYRAVPTRSALRTSAQISASFRLYLSHRFFIASPHRLLSPATARPSGPASHWPSTEFFQPYIRCRHHVFRQLPLDTPAALPLPLPLLPRACTAGVVGHQPLVARLVLARHHRRFAHARMFRQPRLDLAQLNTEAANLYLMIVPPQILDASVPQPSPQVSRAVHPRPSPRQRGLVQSVPPSVRPIQIPPRYSRPSHVHLSHHSYRYRLLVRVQDVHLRVRDRPADMHYARAFLQTAAVVAATVVSVGP